MITKERLEQLIKQCTKIYYIHLSNICCIDFNEYEIQFLNEYEKSFAGTTEDLFKFRVKIKRDLSNWFGIEPNWSEPIYLSESFETKEDAKWKLEMSATYTDTLKLANYTDFENENGDRVFYHKGITYELSLWWASDNTKIIRLIWSSRDGFGCHFEKPLTKENYIEACKLCLRLFKGEEV